MKHSSQAAEGREMRAKRGITFRQKLILAAVLCLLLPATIALSITSYITLEVLKQQTMKNELHGLELTEKYISGQMQNMLYVSNYLYFDSELNRMLKAMRKAPMSPSQELDYYTRITDKLVNVTYSSARMYTTLLTTTGRYYTNYSLYEYDPGQLLSAPWFPAVDKLRAFDVKWIGSHPSYMRSEQNGEHLLTIVRALKFPSGETYAYIIISLPEQSISHIFDNEPARDTFLTDGSGNILSHQDARNIGLRIPFGDRLGLNEKSTLADIDGEEMILSRVTLPYDGYQIYSIIPYKDAMRTIHGIYRTVILIQIASVGLFLLILVYLIRQFTKPLLVLKKTVTEVEKGNLNVRSRVTGNDEIGVLGRALDQLIERINDMIERVKREQDLKRKAEIDMLQAQIHPHFLFNILNSIRLRILIRGDEENASLISSLSSVLRMTFNRHNEFVTLQEELDVIQHSIRLLNFRRNDSVRLVTELSSESLGARVPRFFMQPMIENAFLHGLKDGHGTIRIRAYLVEEQLHVTVEDDGVGMAPEALDRLWLSIEEEVNRLQKLDGKGAAVRKTGGLSGIGLSNVYCRLRLIYQEQFHMDIVSESGRGTRISMIIPTRVG